MLLFAFAIATAASASAVPPANPKTCRRTTSYLAGQAGLYQGQPLRPRKLTELPPGVAYMAVYRRIDGCEAPMTMVEYRGQASGR